MTPNQERCLACSYQEGRGFIPKDVEHTCTQNHSKEGSIEGCIGNHNSNVVATGSCPNPNHSTMEGLEKRVEDLVFSIEGGTSRGTKIRLITEFIAKERESAERRGYQKGFKDANNIIDY